MFKTIIDFFSKPKEETEGEVPVGVCPICWGEQEFDGKIRDIIKDKQIDVQNNKANNSFIQQFVQDNVSGIQLKNEGSRMICPTCEVKS